MGMCKGCREVFNTNDMINGYCNDCLSEISNDNIIMCNKCNTINKSTSRFCKECGNKFESITQEQNQNQEIESDVKNQFTTEDIEEHSSRVKINDFDNSYFTNLKKEKLDDIKEESSINNNAINSVSNVDELLKWAQLLEKGLITKEEFDIKKKDLF